MEDFAPSCAQFIQNLGSFVLRVGMVENGDTEYSFFNNFSLLSAEAFGL